MADQVIIPVKISDPSIPEVISLSGLKVLAVDASNNSKKVDLGLIRDGVDEIIAETGYAIEDAETATANANTATTNANNAAAAFGATIVSVRGTDTTKVINQQKVSADLAAIELSASNEVTARGNADTSLDEKIKNTSTGHDHDGIDSKKVDHANLENKGTNTHAQIDSHIASTTNPHGVTKSQVGLGNVDNTSDVNKPVSTAQANAIATKVGLTGNETIAGIKTFSSFPITPSSAPTTNYQAANKKYVDDADALKENVANKKTVLNASATEYPASSIVKSTIEDNELTVAESIAMLYQEIDGIKDLLAVFIASTITVDTLTVMTALNLFGETNLIIKATMAPVPDFIGQFFINTTSAPYVGYIAIGTTSASDWKQITN